MNRWLRQPKLHIGGLVLLISICSFGGLWWSYHRVQDVVSTELTLAQPLNILVMGIDDEAPLPKAKDGRPVVGQRTDVLLLMALRPAEKKITLLSIPRDSLVDLPGVGEERINAAHIYGGIPLTEKVVLQVTGLPVHRYIQVDFEGFVQLVDLVGGVEVNVDKRMLYLDKSAGLRIDLKKGRQTLRGKDALGYVRFRHDPLGDINRVGRQQQLVLSLLKKMMKPGILLKVTKLYGIARNNVKTNLTFGEIAALARFAQGIGGQVVMESHTLPGSFAGPCWRLDASAVAKLTKPLMTKNGKGQVFEEKEQVKDDEN